MRFPFAFMGFFSLAVGAWMFFFLITHPRMDPFAGGLITMSAFLMVAFGSFVVYRVYLERKAARGK